MQITLTPATPAETRLIAAFLQDLADLQEIPDGAATLASAKAPEEPAPRKPRARKDKADSNPPTPAPSEPSSADAPPVEDAGAPEEPASAPETPSAASAEEADESSPNETAETAEKIDHDSLRVLMGRCAQASKRAESVQVVKGFGYSGISAIKPEHFAEINKQLKALLNG